MNETKLLTAAINLLQRSFVQLDANVVVLTKQYTAATGTGAGGTGTGAAPSPAATPRPGPLDRVWNTLAKDLTRDWDKFGKLVSELLGLVSKSRVALAAQKVGGAAKAVKDKVTEYALTAGYLVKGTAGAAGRALSGSALGRTTKSAFGKLRAAGKGLRKSWAGRAGKLAGKTAGHVGKAAKGVGKVGLKAAGGMKGLGGAAGGAVAGVAAAALAVVAMPFQKVIALLSPMSVMAQMISSAASGFSIFATAVKVLAATLAPILLPLFFQLAVGVLEASDILQQDLAPALGDIFKLFDSLLIPAVDALVSAFTWCSRQMIAIIQWIKDHNPFDDDGEAAPAFDTKRADDASKASHERAKNDTLAELRQSMGPKAQFSGIAAAGKNLQTAALNVSPFEQRIMERFNTAVTALEGVERNTAPRTDGRFEKGGDYGGADYGRADF